MGGRGEHERSRPENGWVGGGSMRDPGLRTGGVGGSMRDPGLRTGGGGWVVREHERSRPENGWVGGGRA